MALISASEFILFLKRHPEVLALDVRSESEFESTALPQSVNLPILRDEHRHLVGIEYKKMGQGAAVELGLSLTCSEKDTMIEAWRVALKKNEPHSTPLFCWRGGLRSKMAEEWLHPREVLRVEGGYKAIRRELLKKFEAYPSLLVLAGMTGSGKTRLLKEFSFGLDLEGMAEHRGSAFGYRLDGHQPAQAVFENRVAFGFSHDFPQILIEDESQRIGRVHLPPGLYSAMGLSPRVLLEVPLIERSQNIYDEYLKVPYERGAPLAQLKEFFVLATQRISKALGGDRFKKVQTLLERGFQSQEAKAHLDWIGFLLAEYYDPMYRYQLQQKTTAPLFSGSYEECREFIRSQCGE